MTHKPDLDAAYALETPEDNRALYRDWAESYDEGFAAAMNYQLPAHVARIFAKLGGEGPVLDVGAGTGLLAQHLSTLGNWQVDGLDISAEMLETARKKGLYRDTITADLTQALPIETACYAGLASSGTFTHGHVGPDALDELIRVALPGALFCLSVNSEHFQTRGFEAKFKALAEQIEGFALFSVTIYGDGAEASHAEDTAQIVVFRKA